MMVWLSLLWCGQIWQNEAIRIECDGPRGGSVYRLAMPQAPALTFEGQVISFNRHGLLLESDKVPDSWVWLEVASGKNTSLKPPPDEKPAGLQTDLSGLDQPAFVSDQHLMVRQRGFWMDFPLPLWFDYLATKPIPGSVYGLKAAVPMMFQRDAEHLWIYQPKQGQLRICDLSSGRSAEQTLDKKMVPIALKEGLLWIDAPRDGQLGLNRPGPDFGIAHNLTLKNLSHSSLVYPAKKGVWILTFSDDFGDARRSWEKGVVEVDAFYVSIHNQKLQAQNVALGSLPVEFGLTTSASGSPRLQVDPNFEILVVGNDSSESLALCLKGQIRLIQKTGRIENHPLQVAPDAIWSITASKTGYLVRSTSGQTELK